MKPDEFFNELSYPLRSSSILVVIVTFFLLLSLARLASLLGIWLAVMVVPALFRYLIMVAAARARGVEASPPGIEFFSLIGNVWTLFPALPAGVYVWGLQRTLEWGVASAWIFSLTMAALFPAMMAVLVITHSPLESLNPLAWLRLVKRVGASYLYAPVLLVAMVLLASQLGELSNSMQLLISLYLAFGFYAVVGAMIREQSLIEEVDIPAPLEVPHEKLVADLLKERTLVLDHAYGFMSRGNRDGGLRHISDWLTKDPDPDAAWPWFFEQMLRWDSPEHALFFAQRYIHRLLAQGEQVRAVKMILRGRLLNEQFCPATDDLPAAIEAAEACNNGPLADDLQRL